MPNRFVILRHKLPKTHGRGGLHWDLMLEYEGVLRTWALDSPPGAQITTPAIQLPDHRLAYLDFEGDISGGRGQVTRWDCGNYEMVAESDEQLIFQVHGNVLQGLTLELVRTDDEWSVRCAE